MTPAVYTGVLPNTVYDPLSNYPDPANHRTFTTPPTAGACRWSAAGTSRKAASTAGHLAGAGGAPDYRPLLQDGHTSVYTRTFTAVVANGWYLVSVTMGDASFAGTTCG